MSSPTVLGAPGRRCRASGALLGPRHDHGPEQSALSPYVGVEAVGGVAGLDGDCLADIAVPRAAPGVRGRIAADATVSRTIDALTKGAPVALAAITSARAAARARAWQLAGEQAPDHASNAECALDVDATPPSARSEKESARPTFSC